MDVYNRFYHYPLFYLPNKVDKSEVYFRRLIVVWLVVSWLIEPMVSSLCCTLPENEYENKNKMFSPLWNTFSRITLTTDIQIYYYRSARCCKPPAALVHFSGSPHLHCSPFFVLPVSPLSFLFSFPLNIIPSLPLPACSTTFTVCPPLSISVSLPLHFCLLFPSHQKVLLFWFLIASNFSISNAAFHSAYTGAAAEASSEILGMFLLWARRPPTGCLHLRSSSINYSVSSCNLFTSLYSKALDLTITCKILCSNRMQRNK